MALKLKKDIKKSSYYVWFLGAKESKGLRGSEFILPVIENLEEREKDVEPFKVTLQLSHKGLKIIQNILSTQHLHGSSNGNSSSSSSNKVGKAKSETIKHFIPHNTITCVHQKEDIIACILLLFNPVTKCPLHVHAYRCDSLETATLLKSQLQMLIERPENQKKFMEIENRLRRTTIKESKKFDSSLGSSDTGTSCRESESSEERFGNDSTRVTSLYDSVAAELRAKLNKRDVPILLPPRDYDTVHRQKGNLTGIEMRRCLNTSIVGQNVAAAALAQQQQTKSTKQQQQQQQRQQQIESSGGSSGIGSDHAPSPDSPQDERFHGGIVDGHSTSDDEWNAENDTSLYLLDCPTTTTQRTLQQQQSTTTTTTNTTNTQMPLIRQNSKPERIVPDSKYDYHLEQRKPRQFEPKVSKQHLEEHIRKKLAQNRYQNNEQSMMMMKKYHEVQQQQPPTRMERYQHHQQKDDYLERRYTTQHQQQQQQQQQRKYLEKEVEELELDYEREKFYHPAEQAKAKYYYNNNNNNSNKKESREFYESTLKKSVSSRQRSPSPIRRHHHQFEEIKISPRDRFKDAKEKFKLLERERFDEERKMQLKSQQTNNNNKYYDLEPPISPVHKEQPFLKRHESVHYAANKDFDNRRFYGDDDDDEPKEHIERYRSPHAHDKFDPKRRSMFNLSASSDENNHHKRNSMEIAKELKRRSYMERTTYTPPHHQDYYDHHYEDNNNSKGRFEGQNFSKSTVDLDQLAAATKYVKNNKTNGGGGGGGGGGGYRNSYAEPKYRGGGGAGEKSTSSTTRKYEMLHRTNSSVSNNNGNGRVGIASIHPY